MEKNVEVVRDKNKHKLIKIFYQLSLLIFVYGNNAWNFNEHDTKKHELIDVHRPMSVA